MVNSNLNVRLFPFFNSVAEPLKVDSISDSYWNNGYNKMAIEVSGPGSGELTVEACINTVSATGSVLVDDDCQWTALSVMAAPDHSIIEQITETGIYYVDITGLSRIRIKAENISGNGLTVVAALGKSF